MGFHQPDKRLVEKYGKPGSHFKKYLKKLKKIGVDYQEYGSSLKIDFPLISNTVSASRKNLRIKQ